MQTYRPSTPPADMPVAWRQWLIRELEAIHKAANAANDNAGLRYLTALPARPGNGVYLFEANVTATVASRGMYRYDATTETYTFIA